MAGLTPLDPALARVARDARGARAEPSFSHVPGSRLDAGGGTVRLCRRIAELTRLLDERDRTIGALLGRGEEARPGVDGAAAQPEPAPAAAEREKDQLREALERLRVAQSRLLQSQKMVSIGQLAAGIAHELNTPIQYAADNVLFMGRAFEAMREALAAAMRVVEAARAGPVAEALLERVECAYRDGDIEFLLQDLPDALEQSREGLRRIAAIVGAMKKFSHPSSDTKTPADLAEIVETTVVVARNEWKYVAEVEMHFDPDLPPVPCLRDDVGNAILNLIVNAAHAVAEVVNAHEGTPKGRITVSTRRLGAFAEICVADTGNGIPAQIRDRVFDPFFTTKPVGVGTGQGLAIAYATVVEQHRGEIFFESEPGRGTTFHVRLPLVPRGEAP